MGWLDGKVAVITGAGAGIGRAIAEGFFAEGARIACLDRDSERLQALRREVPQAITQVGDVLDPAANREVVAEAERVFGKVDVFVANAGIFDGFGKALALPEEAVSGAFTELFAVNVLSLLWGLRASEAALRRARGSFIVTVSGAGLLPGGGGALYTASKHAAVGFVRQMAKELAPEVRVNAVAPGGTVSELAIAPSLRPHVVPPDPNVRAERIRQGNPMQLVMMPEDHVGAYVLLASDRSRAITGEVIASDGGLAVR